MSKQLQIRNSTAEFLIFQAEDKAQGVQVFYQDENIWATQKYAETEFEKYRVIQDRLFESDFDRFALPTLPFEDNEEKLK